MNYNNPPRAVAWWLFICCAMVFVTMVVGGITRLTHSGLSIVEWKPLIGALPPLSESHWLELFAKYQQTPEFQKVNHDMTLDGFKFIFWWEWAHRLSGRLIGVVFLLPYLFFLARGYLKGSLAAKVFGFFILGGLQGAMGWYMVKSGLVDDPRVSQYRLAAHLGLAFILFGLMFWTGLGMLQRRAVLPAPSHKGIPLRITFRWPCCSLRTRKATPSTARCAWSKRSRRAARPSISASSANPLASSNWATP